MKPAWQGGYRKKPRARQSRGRRTLGDMGYKDLVPILDREFSLLVRLSAADDSGFTRCATCGAPHQWDDITLGHYVSRSHHSVRWDARNVAPQCSACNCFRGGEQHKMRAHLVRVHGEREVKAVEALAELTRTENSDSLRRRIAECREEVRRLRKEKCL